LFIVLEGIDGAGTTTQAQLLGQWLSERGQDELLTEEPTPARVGALIRRILQKKLLDAETGQPLDLDEQAMALLFAADRSDHLDRTILPAINAGRIVVSDRHYLSSVAYQSAAADIAWVEGLNAGFRRPDLTVYLDIAPQASLQRKHGQGNAAERYETLDYLRRVRQQYALAIEHARAAGERIETLDAEQPPEEVARAIRELLDPMLAEA
jgi:dTMP kinase